MGSCEREVMRGLDRDVDDINGVLLIAELGFNRRHDAFAKLFRLRDESREVQIQPNQAMLIPVQATDGGPDWLVWELVEEGNATYLFRPKSEESRVHLFTWLGDTETMSRRALLDSEELQSKVGFTDRVIHRGIEETLDSWWGKLGKALGREREK